MTRKEIQERNKALMTAGGVDCLQCNYCRPCMSGILWWRKPVYGPNLCAREMVQGRPVWYCTSFRSEGERYGQPEEEFCGPAGRFFWLRSGPVTPRKFFE